MSPSQADKDKAKADADKAAADKAAASKAAAEKAAIAAAAKAAADKAEAERRRVLAEKAAVHFTPERLERCWRQALDDWGMEVTLSPPAPLSEQKRDSDWGGDEPLAYIDLVSRQVVVNYPLLFDIGAKDSLTGVFAHELGHHLKFPHTLGLAASLQLLEQSLIPALPHSLTNLFFDLQVNEFVGRVRSEELAQVYRGFTRKPDATITSLFHFYLAIYEELWGLPPGDLTQPRLVEEMEKKFPGYRADARMFVQTFYALPEVYTQFVYFCSRVIRYLDPEQDAKAAALPLMGDVPEPGIDDYQGALGGNSMIDRALEEAEQRGWFTEDNAKSVRATDVNNGALSSIEKLSQHLPGHQAQAFKEALVGHIYKRLLEQHLIKLPSQQPPSPDPFLPTTEENWELGDNPRSIDWTLSVLRQGPLAAMNPLRRELEIEPPNENPNEGTWVEIYLDTSGSMPNPSASVNVMTLAAQILSAAAIRKGGRVRGIIYSSDHEESEWMYNEDKARSFLLHYSGGGTDFPFAVFQKFAAERREVVRVIISDSDFLSNVTGTAAQASFRAGLDSSRLCVALLALWQPEQATNGPLKPFINHSAFRLAVVTNPNELPQAAAKLSQALWSK